MDDNRRNIDENIDEEQQAVPEVEKPDTELEKARGLAVQFESNYKRALADYQNLQRRTQEEKIEWIRMASRDLVLKFLPVLDTLVLATKHIDDKGIKLSVDQFLKVLQDEGIIKIDTIGHEFDPKLMEAVTTAEADKKDKDKVIEEVRAGFMFGEYVLRPAQVVVGK